MSLHQSELTASVPKRVLELKGASNFRDLGGYTGADGRTVKWGKLYRSADLSCLTEQDLVFLRTLELAWICDLRSDGEVEQYPSPPIGLAVNEQLSFLAEANPEEMMASQEITIHHLAEMNRALVNRTETAASFIDKLLHNNGQPILFYCMAGKDRTGFVASLILQALGVSREQITEDYLLTNKYVHKFKERMSANSSRMPSIMKKLSPEVLAALMSVRPEYIEAAFDEIDRQYGGFEGYWRDGLGLSLDDLECLRELYLE